ncbi:MAG: hypothetical protein PVG24_04335 [Gammaproteobacteria bacterium]|jgi:hypothetical protein
MNVQSDSTASRPRIERRALYAAVLTACLAAPALHAQPVSAGDNVEEVTNVGIAFGAGRSDNVLRQGSGGSSATYTALGADLDIVRTRRRLNMTVASDLEYRTYSTSGLDSERVGIIDASLEALAVPERFSWFLGGRGGQGRTDPFGIESPQNRENIDIFETGPRFTLPIGQRTNVEISATAGRRYFEVTDTLDSKTTDVEAGLYRALSSTARFGIVVSSRSTDYQFDEYDNDVERAYVSYSRTLATGSASFAVGSNRADFETRTETEPYLSAQWRREVGTRSMFNATIVRQLIDAGDNIDYDRLVVYGGDAGGIDESLLLSQDVFESTELRTSFTIRGTRTIVTFGAAASEARYTSDVALDNDVLRLTASAERAVSSRMSVGVDLDHSKRDFIGRPQIDKDTFSELWVRRNFAGPFSGRLGFRHNSRSGTQTFNFDENVWTLGFQYDIRSTGGDQAFR